MIRRPPRSTLDRSSAASDVYKRQPVEREQRGAVLRDREGAHAAPLLVARHVAAVEAGLEAARVVDEGPHRAVGQELGDQQELVLRPVLPPETSGVQPGQGRVDLLRDRTADMGGG